MNLRLAKKISKAILHERADCYSGWQQRQAIDRVERTKSAKAATQLWNEIMEAMGPEGRRELVDRMMIREAVQKAMETPLTDEDKAWVDAIPDDAVDHWMHGETWNFEARTWETGR